MQVRWKCPDKIAYWKILLLLQSSCILWPLSVCLSFSNFLLLQQPSWIWIGPLKEVGHQAGLENTSLNYFNDMELALCTIIEFKCVWTYSKTENLSLFLILFWPSFPESSTYIWSHNWLREFCEKIPAKTIVVLWNLQLANSWASEFLQLPFCACFGMCGVDWEL